MRADIMVYHPLSFILEPLICEFSLPPPESSQPLHSNTIAHINTNIHNHTYSNVMCYTRSVYTRFIYRKGCVIVASTAKPEISDGINQD